MDSKWPVVRIDEIRAPIKHSVAMGPFGSRIKTDNFVPSGVPVIRGGNLNAERFRDEDFVFLTEEKADELRSANASPGDLVFTHRGTIGQVGIIPNSARYPRYVVSQSQMKLTCDAKKVNPLFVFYYFRSPLGQHELLMNTWTSGVPAIGRPLTSLKSARITLPPLYEQHAIAHVLGTLDEKIELNRRVNRSLEAIARAIFKSWFVDFDPVWAKMDGEQPYGMDAKTAALFPAAFVDSELGPIPEGWRVGTLGEIAENPRRSVQPENVSPDTPYIGLQHMPQQNIALTEWGEAQEVSSNKYAFAEREILFGKLRPYFHKVGVAPLDGLCSTDILVVIPKSQKWYGLVLCYLSSVEFVDYSTAVSTGTRMPRTNWRDMSRYGIVVPPQNVALAFNQRVVPLIDAIRNNIFQSQTLAELRDTLLPKLISGQLPVPDAEQFIKEDVWTPMTSNFKHY